MYKKSAILSVLLATTFLTPNVSASTPLKSDGAISYTSATQSDYDFMITSTDSNGDLVKEYYKIALDASKLGTAYSLSDTEPTDGTFSAVVLPDGTTKYVVYSGTPTNTRLTDATGDVTGDFAGLSIVGEAENYGAAVYNDGTLGNITGDFIQNSVDTNSTSKNDAKGGAVYNSSNGVIANISGDFIGNSAKGRGKSHGGAIYNKGTIGNITGNFISNKSEQVKGANLRGGAIYNEKSIGNIIGDFINNSLVSSSSYVQGGAIANDTNATIESIQGSFIGNNVSTSSTDSMARGGAIFTRENLTFKTGGQTQVISGNTTTDSNGVKDYNAIYVADNSKYITFDTSSGGAWILNDTIDVGGALTANTSNTFHFVAQGDDTVNEGTTSQYVAVNNALVNTKYVNVENTTLKFGEYTHEANSDKVLHAEGKGEFVSADGSSDTSVRLTNAVFDLANGYRDVLSLKKFEVIADDAGKYNGYVHLNLDIANGTSDVLYVDGTISGKTKLIVHADSDAQTDKKFYFAYSKNEFTADDDPLSYFSVYRVYKSPFMYDVNYAAVGGANFAVADADKEGDEYKNAWYLTMNSTVNNGQFVEDDNTGGDDNTGTGGDDNTGTGGDDNTGTGGDDNTGTGGDDNTGTGGDDNTGTGGDDNTGTGGDDNTGTGGDDNTGTGGDDNTGTGGDDNT
ncbi:MAG: hypothetical protein E7016_07025, partial [Alphaproteobacteria bacterium]|nr:hypothetical protein [Alphaproteobacteria bacterium]